MIEVKIYSALLCMGDASHYIDCVHVSDYYQLKAENERLGYEVEHLGVVGLQQVSAMLKAQQESDTLRKQLDEARELLTDYGYATGDLDGRVDAWLAANPA